MAAEKSFDLIAFDLDGTLVHRNEEGVKLIPKELLDTVLEISQKIPVMIATGRRYRTARELVDPIEKLQYLVCHNGLVVCDREGEYLHRSDIEIEQAKKLTSILNEYSLPAIWTFDGSHDHLDFAFSASDHEEHEILRTLCERFPRHIRRLEWDEIEQSEPHRASLIEVVTLAMPNRLSEVRDEIEDKIPDAFRTVVITNCGYEPYAVMELFEKRFSKWTGIERIREEIGASRVLAVGDDENDIEMIQQADFGLVMSHAPAHVKAHADIEANGVEGLLDYLRGLL